MKPQGMRLGVQLVLAGCFLGACGGLLACGSAIPENWKPPEGLGHFDTYLRVRILGPGEVTFLPLTQPCINADDGLYFCEPRLWRGTSVALQASTEPGWTFVRWYIPSQPQSTVPFSIAPSSATQLVLPLGTQTEIGARFSRKLLPLEATRDETHEVTVYRTTLTDPRLEELKVRWSGPTCGEWGPQGEAISFKALQALKMTWVRPPGCDASHTEVVLSVSGWEDGGTVVCTFSGAESGTGAECLESA